MTYNITINNYGPVQMNYGASQLENGNPLPYQSGKLSQQQIGKKSGNIENDFLSKLQELYQSSTSKNGFEPAYVTSSTLDKSYLKNLPALMSILEMYERKNAK